MPGSGPGSHLHLMTRRPGSPEVRVSAPLDAARIAAILREGGMTEPGLIAAAAGESPAAIVRRGTGWVAVASCEGDCEGVAALVAERAEPSELGPEPG